MTRFNTKLFVAFLAFGLVACGGGDAGTDDAADSDTAAMADDGAMADDHGMAVGALSMPDWMTVDEAARTVTIDLVAGSTDANNHWNFNGHANGSATVVVPQGYNVTINFSNQDPVNFHSVAVLEMTSGFPVSFDNASPAFEGAMTSNATSMTDATGTGESESIQFTAANAGDFSLACLIPAHATTGMWIGFTVSADGEAGVRS